MQPVKVHFPGHGVFWFREDADGAGSLAPLDHCGDGGDILSLDVALCGESYAHVFRGGVIKRFGKVIGNKSDFKPVIEAHPE